MQIVNILSKIVVILLILWLIISVLRRYRETRADALKRGYGRFQSTVKGLVYVGIALGGIYLLLYLMVHIEKIGFLYGISLILLFYFAIPFVLKGIFDKKSKTILIVDDEKAFSRSLKTDLEKNNKSFSILTAQPGEMAFELLKSRPVALIVTGQRMTEMDGFDVIKHVKTKYPEIPVVMMTADYSSEIKNRALENGAIACIAKPFRISELSEIITRHLGKSNEKSR